MTGLGLGLPHRPRELGRLRIGRKVAVPDKPGRFKPQRLHEWRLTSTSKRLVIHAAELYGGDVREWDDRPTEAKQWELFTDTSEIEVILPPDALSQSWEMWSGGGCQRRCDGRVMDTGEVCVCPADINERLAGSRLLRPTACKAITRLSVIIPDLPDLGIWLLTTTSVNAAVEMPGVIETMRGMLNDPQYIPTTLIIDPRTEVRDGQTRHFVVPALSLPRVTVKELLSAAGAGGADLMKALLTPRIAQAALEASPAALDAGTAEVPSDGGTGGQAPAGDLKGLMERINALRPASKVGECMKAVRERFGPPSEMTDEQIAEASNLVAAFEPIDVGAAPRSAQQSPASSSTEPNPARAERPTRTAGSTEESPPVEAMDRADLVAEISSLDSRARITAKDSTSALQERLAALRSKQAAARATEALASSLAGGGQPSMLPDDPF